ncbi:MAG: PfkB family carbohydrate kinase [Bacilli bacterium]
MKILCIGHASYDITTPVDSYPVENTKSRVHDLIECGGGPASNAAYLLGKWGLDVTFAGVVGNDLYGRRIKEEFNSVGVNTKYLFLKDNECTPSSHIIANRSSGSRTILTYRPSLMKLADFELDFEPDIILIDGQECEFSMKMLKQYPKAISIIDASRDRKEIIELSKIVDYLVCSVGFALQITKLKIDYANHQSLVNLYKALKKIFNNNIVVTLEDKGCLYMYNNEIKIMPAIKVKAIDTTGAGDIFHGAFTYGIAKKNNFECILKIANIAGAISVTRIGGRNSIPTGAEMREVYNEFR